MNTSLLAEILQRSIQTFQLNSAMEGIKQWSTSPQANVDELLALIPRPNKERVAALISDVLGGYPTQLLACPILFKLHAATPQTTAALPTHISAGPLAYPNKTLSFQGWANETYYGLHPVFSEDLIGSDIQVRLAIFKDTSEVGGAALMAPEAQWWSTVIGLMQANVTCSPGPLVPYLGGPKAAEVMLTAAKTRKPARGSVFLSDVAWAEAYKTGIDFSTHTAKAK